MHMDVQKILEFECRPLIQIISMKHVARRLTDSVHTLPYAVGTLVGIACTDAPFTYLSWNANQPTRHPGTRNCFEIPLAVMTGTCRPILAATSAMG
mmetsp:Transcript_10947/g.30251  ORF Transcript_10947/g.30251 Transcript_10947/m.30251 type:complete len:96 (-) Transcript_10947:1365-1652(-)